MKKPIKLKFQNGLSHQFSVAEILSELTAEFDFLDSEDPDYIIFGPYGNDIPQPGSYVRIGYFCENIKPDLSICDWAFGIPSEGEINDPKYKRIQWHNLNPQQLVKNDWDAERILASKTRFCNFFYSHPVPYREEFFRQLSKYKKVDAPGKSMNNMPSADHLYGDDKWAAKRAYLSPYKFTIAFENYVYPGYQTEKLYDAMLCQSLPIYCGDPNVSEIFNTKSFVNAADHVTINNSPLVKLLESKSQWNFTDIRPQYFRSPKNKIQRKLKFIGKKIKMQLQFNKLDFTELIDRVIYLDQNPDAYLAYLKEPWFNNNTPPANASLKDRWREIFSGK